MTTLIRLHTYAGVARLAIIAAALAIAIIAFAGPAVMEAAGAGTAGATEDVYCSFLIFGIFGWLMDLASGGALERSLNCG